MASSVAEIAEGGGVGRVSWGQPVSQPCPLVKGKPVPWGLPILSASRNGDMATLDTRDFQPSSQEVYLIADQLFQSLPDSRPTLTSRRPSGCSELQPQTGLGAWHKLPLRGRSERNTSPTLPGLHHPWLHLPAWVLLLAHTYL